MPLFSYKNIKNPALITLPHLHSAELDSLCDWCGYFCMKEIKLTQGRVTLVDDEDYEYLNQFKWCAHKTPNTFYAVRNAYINGKQVTVRMHAEILGISGGDHADGDGLNNQRCNLRICTHQQNMWNRQIHKITKYKYIGVQLNPHGGKWIARIRYNGKNIHIGSFVDEIDAAKAYNTKAIEFRGEFANLNKI